MTNDDDKDDDENGDGEYTGINVCVENDDDHHHDNNDVDAINAAVTDLW